MVKDQSKTRLLVRLAAIGIASLALILVGCASEESSLDRFPTLSQVQSRLKPKHTDPPEPAGSTPKARIAVQQLSLPIHRPTRGAWQSVIDQSMFPDLTRRAWQANGVRVGMLAAGDRSKLQKALPPILRSRRQTMYASSHPASLLQAPSQTGTVNIDLSMFLDGGSQTRSFKEGRMRLLAKVQRNDNGRFVLHLIPQHYKHELSLKPRDPLDKELDGTVFSQLALRMPVPRNQFLVLGLHRAKPAPSEAGDGTFRVEPRDNDDAGDGSNGSSKAGTGKAEDNGADDASSSEAGQNGAGESTGQGGDKPQSGDDADGSNASKSGASDGEEDQSEGERIEKPLDMPPHFGRALFAGRELGAPVQVLVLIHIKPIER
jgi:hypothetical protein